MKTIANVVVPMKTKNSLNVKWGDPVWESAKRTAEKRKVLKLLPRLTLAPAVVVTLTRCSAGHMDDDGLRSALKSVRDAVAYRLGLDDGSSLVRWEYRQESAPPKQQQVKILVEAV